MKRTFLAAAAASLLLAASGGAQEAGAAAAPDTYELGEDGAATHKATGAVCPAQLGDLVLAQVMSFDREGDHLGIGCQYANPTGFNATIRIFRKDEPGLVGPGSSAERWNRELYTILSNYPAALPANVAGIEGDPAQGLRGALFTANASGLPVRIGVWQAEVGDWELRAQATFVATVEGGWTLAEQTRSTLLTIMSQVRN